MKEKLSGYLPGIVLFAIAVLIGFFTWQDYGIAWDEPLQRGPGVLSYEYMFHGKMDLFTKETDNHGAGFEVPLVMLEKWLGYTDKHDIYLMRHMVTHLLFLVSALAIYVLTYRMYRNKWLACLAFLMLAFAPRIYAHSWFNTKDLPFLSMYIITLAYSQYAFDKNKTLPYLLLGLLCGYATSIRIMGIMLLCLFLGFLVLDMIMGLKDKSKTSSPAKPALHMVLLLAGFGLILFAAWPYLWKNPFGHFAESFTKMSKFNWNGSVLMGGKFYESTKLGWTYFPRWFFMSNPELWLITGLSGMGWVVYDFFKSPIQFLSNTRERNHLLHLVCFVAPIFAVVALHSVIYDDWRHLYFVYPAFVMLAIYCIHKVVTYKPIAENKKLTMVVQGVLALQIVATISFMIQNHPFHQVYFNNLVSHEEEYLRKNYEMDYWGVSNMQALKYILEHDNANLIRVTSIYPEILQNNIDMLPPDDRKHFVLLVPDSAQYLITNFRFHPDDFQFPEEYSFKVLNSTVIRIYKME